MFIDLIFAVIIFLACIKGLKKGFVIAVFSVIAFIIGLAAALKLSALVASRLAENVNVSDRWLPPLSFALVFFIVVLLVNLGGRLIQKTIELAMLGWLNRLAGVILFFLLYSVIFSIFLFFAVQLHLLNEATIKNSQVYTYIQPVGPAVINRIGAVIPVFKDIFSQLEHFFGDVSNKMQH